MEQAYPQPEDDPNALEGTQAHAVNVAVFNGTPIPAYATEEMLEGADLWVETIEAYRDGIHIEERVDCPSINPLNWGTPDAWHFDRAHGILRVWDYKFGHRHVEVYKNWQLINYVAGALDAINITGLTDQHVQVEMVIVQPRSYHKDGPVRSWKLVASDLRGHFNELRRAYDLALSASPMLATGKECRDCSARHACTTLQAGAYDSVQITGESVPFDLPPHALSRELYLLRSASEILSARISGLESEVLGRIKQGSNVPGWTIEQGYGREKWARPIEEIVALGQMMGVDISKPGAITPKQAIKKGLPAELVSGYAETPLGEIKLVADDGNKPRKIFGGA